MGAGATEAAAAEKEPPPANIPTAIKYQDDNSLAHPNVSAYPIFLAKIYPTFSFRAAPGMRAGLCDTSLGCAAPHTIPALAKRDPTPPATQQSSPTGGSAGVLEL